MELEQQKSAVGTAVVCSTPIYILLEGPPHKHRCIPSLTPLPPAAAGAGRGTYKQLGSNLSIGLLICQYPIYD